MLLRIGSIGIFKLSNSEVFSRHAATGLLTQYWAYKASLLPLVALGGKGGNSVLILGQPSSSRLLALAQASCLKYLDAIAASSKADEGSASQDPKQSQTTGSAPESSESRSRSGRNIDARSATAERLSLDSGTGWQVALPWPVYGEGQEPSSWRQQGAEGLQTSAIRRQNSCNSQQQAWTSLGWLIESLLHRSVRVGHLMSNLNTASTANPRVRGRACKPPTIDC